MISTRNKRPAPPLDEESLQALALRYAARYATSRVKLALYLQRKLTERGWDGAAPPAPDMLVARLAELRYVDDEAYARMKAGAMQRRGLGRRRIDDALRHAGVADEAAMLETSESEAWAAAERLARRKRVGPFAAIRADRQTAQKHIALFLRAGHDLTTARAWALAEPGEPPACPEDDR